MKFRKGSAYQLISECGEYSVAKVIVLDQVQYEAWYLEKGKQPIALSARQPTSLACIEICRRHHEKRGKAAA